jgi:hypothetical protein
MERDSKATKTNEITPISDGDTRPDQSVDNDPNKTKKHTNKRTTEAFTVNRKRDVNSLEDHKDAM